MNKTLSFYPFFTATITITAITIICFFNMYLLARHRKSYFTIIINITSLFTISFLVFHMMGHSVFVLSLAQTYLKISHVALLLTISSTVIGVGAIIIGIIKHNYQNMSTNILNALSNIENIVFVADIDGNITHMNHPKKFTSLFGNFITINEFISFIESHCCGNWKYGKDIEAMEDTAVCSLALEKSNTYYLLKITPIINNGSSLGYTAILEDISLKKANEKLLQERNHYLTQANERLSNYVRVAGALEAEKERLAILENVQKTLICHIEKILLTIGKDQHNCFDDYTYPTFMKNLATQLREVYSTVRNAISNIAGKEG